MPVTFILLSIYIAAIGAAIVGFAKKVKTLKIISVLLFLIGIMLTTFLVFVLKGM